jgi:hypothetical protein
VISLRTRSSSLSVVVGLVMYVWCECGVRVYRVVVCSYMNKFYSCTQMRGVKKVTLHDWRLVACCRATEGQTRTGRASAQRRRNLELQKSICRSMFEYGKREFTKAVAFV